MKPIIQNLLENYNWLQQNLLIHEDVVIQQLANPELIIDGKTFVSFSSNNYLGLSKRQEVIKAANEALIKYGDGTSESRKLGGNLCLLEELEDVISNYKDKEDTILFATGLLANIGIIPAITDINHYMKLFYQKEAIKNEVVIIGDQLNHRSIQMGIKLSKAHHDTYLHNNIASLQEKLEQYKNASILLITDSLFSMDGDLAPLDEIVKLAEHYKAAILIDEAHGSGVFGKTGKGVAEHFNLTDKIDFIMGTLSKAFGGMGGFVSADKQLIDLLKINTSTYYFTSSLPASVAAGLIAAIKIAAKEDILRINLWKNVHHILCGLFNLGVDFPLRFSQIIPMMLYDEDKAYKMEKVLLENGILCNAVSVPAVAPGKARLRISINSTHSFSHIDKFLNIIGDYIKILDIPLIKRDKSEWDSFLRQSPDYIISCINLDG